MTEYLDRFKSMAHEIETHPLVDLVEVHINRPATDQEFAVVEKKIEAPLAESIRQFYSQANGLRLRWRVKTDFSDKKFEKIQDKYDDYWIEWPEEEDEDIPFAKIDLVPLEDCFISLDWEKVIIPQEDLTLELAGTTFQHSDFARLLRPFDLFSTYSCMAFLLEKGNGNPKVLLLSDYYIEWSESRITDFESYLEMLFVTRGIVESREEIYGEPEGHMKPLLVTGPNYWKKKHIPKLFR